METKYALLRIADGAPAPMYLRNSQRAYSMDVDDALMFPTHAAAVGYLIANGPHNFVPVAVDITETEGTLTELPTLQEGEGVVFAFKLTKYPSIGPWVTWGPRANSVRFSHDVEAALTFETRVEALYALQERVRTSTYSLGRVDLVALKRTPGTKQYTVRELK